MSPELKKMPPMPKRMPSWISDIGTASTSRARGDEPAAGPGERGHRGLIGHGHGVALFGWRRSRSRDCSAKSAASAAPGSKSGSRPAAACKCVAERRAGRASAARKAKVPAASRWMRKSPRRRALRAAPASGRRQLLGRGPAEAQRDQFVDRPVRREVGEARLQRESDLVRGRRRRRRPGVKGEGGRGRRRPKPCRRAIRVGRGSASHGMRSVPARGAETRRESRRRTRPCTGRPGGNGGRRRPPRRSGIRSPAATPASGSGRAARVTRLASKWRWWIDRR